MSCLEKIGLTIEEVRRALPLGPDQVRRITANMVPKHSCGRRGLPDYVVNAMYADYQRLGNLYAVAPLYHRTQQSIWETFKTRGLNVKPRNIGQKINYRGLVYTPGKRGVFRCTMLDRHWLHHRMWEDISGRKVPQGWQVSFKNGDCTDLRFENFVCATAADITRHHQRRLHPASSLLTPAERLARQRKSGREYMARRAAAFVQRGLRSDGKPRLRRSRDSFAQGLNSRGRARINHRLSPLEAAWRELSAGILRPTADLYTTRLERSELQLSP